MSFHMLHGITLLCTYTHLYLKQVTCLGNLSWLFVLFSDSISEQDG